jgi:hypothetical protein
VKGVFLTKDFTVEENNFLNILLHLDNKEERKPKPKEPKIKRLNKKEEEIKEKPKLKNSVLLKERRQVNLEEVIKL